MSEVDTKWFFCTAHGGAIALEDAEPDCLLVGPYSTRDEAKEFSYE